MTLAHDGEQTAFWFNGGLVVSPRVQLDFTSRLVRDALPAERRHVESPQRRYVFVARVRSSDTLSNPGRRRAGGRHAGRT